MVVCLRTVTDNLNVEEQVLGLHSLVCCDSATIYVTLKDVLQRFAISIQHCRAACFDGASNFQGERSGVVAKLQQEQSRVLATHCYMHCVNLAVQDTVSTIAPMRNFLQLMVDLVNFFRDTPKRRGIVKAVAETMQCPQTHVRPLCPTRFTVKFRTLDGVSKQVQVLREALVLIEQDAGDNKIRDRASGFQRSFN